MDIKPPFVIVADIEDKSGMTAMVMQNAMVHVGDNGHVTITGTGGTMHLINLDAAVGWVKNLQQYVKDSQEQKV